MQRYAKKEARDWALNHFAGVNNVILPSFTSDVKNLNEKAIRFDVNRDIELGFQGALLVAECGTTLEEYIQFVEIAADEAKGRLTLIHHASFNTLEENTEAARLAAAAGADLVLLAYPPSFYPDTARDIYNYTQSFADAVDLAIMLFPIPLWGFERVHGASIPVDMLEELVDNVHNIVAIKAEGGYPSVAGFLHVWNRLSDRVLISMPIIQNAIPLATVVPMQVIATSNTEYYGPVAPQMFSLAREGKSNEALDMLWQIAPAWRANESVTPIPAAHMVHRMAWKYQAWLAGFNGGPQRVPTARIVWHEMRAFRRGLIEAGLPVTADEDDKFFEGRNPQ